ncbi:MAG: hypothetical protein NWQ54_20435 [Paraglaciecola sp.]|uniref:hypothetical protein n=1 Tax=Paraglaciecola sp. TaxID=1920173 RepID=UPI00273F2660|nr:hypothetical protein [Paraglaciecola sp.]MDP5030339.1 hypothetical protein [Paraglaciecola sp.]MDP5133256.1 hypothetical protein [Paraglaciecola sp.]
MSKMDNPIPNTVPEERYLYFTERDLTKILENVDALRSSVFPIVNAENEIAARRQQNFPSVCLIGLGRCGSNIALDVASLVYNARNFYLNEFENEERENREQEHRPLRWIKRSLHLSNNENVKPVFLIEPLVMLGDLDKDIEGRVRFSNKGEKNSFLKEYTKMKIMDLSEVHAGGAGNAPILGQYLARIILNKDTQRFANKEWKNIHSYLIDSCGIKANQSRLYFYIFSAGGGTGSGMASEFGLAQQYAYMSKTFETRPLSESDDNRGHSFVFEPIFTSGICILPNISDHGVEMSEALHINAGRLLCKYMAEEWDFSYNFDKEDSNNTSAMHRIRPWNAMMLISNDIMRYAEETDDDGIQSIDVNAMEKHANQYISQQIFNILTAQAVTTDYDENYFRRAGIDIGETIRLDANDLFMSLAGPVALAYAESVVNTENLSGVDKIKLFDKGANELDINDLFFRSIDLPHFNKVTQAIEGISLLPIESSRYRKRLKEYLKSGYDAKHLKDLHFFKNCSSIVSIISLPKDYKLSYMDLNRLKSNLNTLFPNTTLKRYALVIGASANVSLTTLIVKSPCLSDDFLTLIVAYIKRCFAKNNYRFDEKLDQAMVDFIRAEEFDENALDSMLEEYENPAKILDTNWYAIKPMYEKKYRELIREKEKFVSINDIRLSRNNVKKAIKYLREIYRHKISKTQVISLNNDEDDF